MSDMGATYHYTQDNASQVSSEDLVDDSVGGIPITSFGTSQGLKPRFEKRISKLLDASLTVKEDSSERSVEIFLSREQGSTQPRPEMDENLRRFVRDLEPILGSVASKPKGAQLDRATEELWDVILVMSYHDTDNVIQKLKHSFDENKGLFDDFVAKMFGIDDSGHKSWERDEGLGDRLIQLYQAVKAYDKSMKELNLLIHTASEMTRVLLNPRIRLNSLLWKASFANELFELVCELGFPERVYSTMVRAARTSQSFTNVTFHLRPPSPGKRVSFTTSGTSRSAISGKLSPQHPPQEQATGLSQTLDTTSAAQALSQLPTLPVNRQQPGFPVLGPIMNAVQIFLTAEDRGKALFHLEPASKQEAAQLLGTITRGRLLAVQTDAWHSFGFVVTEDEGSERKLAGLYAAIVKESNKPESLFREIQEAAENRKLVQLFDTKEYSHFRDLFPHLEDFLNASPDERPSVWRLKQFIQATEDDEPPPCLKRDYGFRFCKTREDVLLAKAIYDKMLHKMGPKKLHRACVHGRLLQMAMMEGLVIDVKHRRLIQNDFPFPVGFDNDFGLDGYRGTLFRNSEKMKL